MTRTELKKDLDVNTSIYGYLIYERKKKTLECNTVGRGEFFLGDYGGSTGILDPTIQHAQVSILH